MRKLIYILVLAVAVLTLQPGNSEASTYRAKAGDSYWNVAKKHGVSLKELKKANGVTGNLLFAGQKIRIPDAKISKADKELMARLVHAEAKGEPYAGKVAVATVVLNRVESPDFPDTVKEVVYQKVNGHYAFTPVMNGAINEPADESSKQAVNEAIAFRGLGNGSLFFFNPETAESKWVFSREETITIGKHRFAR